MGNKVVRYAVLLALLLGATAGGWMLAGDPKAVKPAADIPDIPEGKCCLVRLGKAGEGAIDLKTGEPYECKGGRTVRGTFQLKVKLKSAGMPCDEVAGAFPKLIPDGSLLVAEGQIIRRSDDLAHLSGKFKVLKPERDEVAFTGTLEATNRLSTAHPPFGQDRCDEKQHLQGWLVGQGEGEMKGLTVRAFITAKATPAETRYNLPAVAIDGVVVECHR
jgi:hypothetical protein